MELIRYTNTESDQARDGLHLPGIDQHDSETLCGNCWSQEPRETIDGDEPTCRHCIAIAQEILARYSKKQAKLWVPNVKIEGQAATEHFERGQRR